SQLRDPVVPQLVVHGVLEPDTHSKPSSVLASQSSSRPLHVSSGAAHSDHAHPSSHVRCPVEPHAVVQLSVSPSWHANTSSAAPLQSSSMPLHTSAGA